MLAATMAKTRRCPGVTLAGPVLLISMLTGSNEPIAVRAVAELFVRSGSVRALLTVAVFTMGSGPA